MIKLAFSKGIDASYVLMDSWFTQQPLIGSIVEQGVDVIVIGMVKDTKQRYLVNDNWIGLKELYQSAQPIVIVKASCIPFIPP